MAQKTEEHSEPYLKARLIASSTSGMRSLRNYMSSLFTKMIGELLRRTIFDIAPDVSNLAYEIISHENRLVLTVRHTEDVTRIFQRAVRQAITTFDIIQKGITAAR